MSQEKSDKLLKKYLEAESSLEEEKALFNRANQEPELAAWASYVRERKKQAPAHLRGAVWQAIQRRRRKKQRLLMRLSGLAAAVALLVSLFIYDANIRQMELREKAALLEEALALFPDEKPSAPQQQVIYEDGLIVIYAEPIEYK